MSQERRSAVIEEHEADTAISGIVRGLLELPWTKAKELCRTGRVWVDGVQIFDPGARVRAGALVEVDRNAPRHRLPALEDERIVHIDHDVVVVDKPAGLVTAPYDERDEDTLLARTRETIRRHEQAKGRTRDGLGVVQRLDKETTGLLVFARTHTARKNLQAQLRAHTVTREYLALVHGTPDEGRIESQLVPNRGDGLRGSWRHPGRPPREAKKAITHVFIRERLQGATLIACRLETGRQHQIRIHLAEAGHPLLGDRIYGRGYRGRRLDAPRVMLHATSLGFRHPAHDRPVQFELPPPEDFERVWHALRER